jgi:predicted membrane protein
MSLTTRTILTSSIFGLGMLTFVSLRHFTAMRTELPLIMLLFVLLARFVTRKNREKVPWVPEIVEKQILLSLGFGVGFLVAFFFGPLWLQILLIVAWIGVGMALDLTAIRHGPSKGTAVQS